MQVSCLYILVKIFDPFSRKTHQYSRGACPPSERIQGALRAFASAIQDMRIDHRCADVFMAEQRLDRSDVGAIFQQVRREAVPLAIGCAAHFLSDLHPILQFFFPSKKICVVK